MPLAYINIVEPQGPPERPEQGLPPHVGGGPVYRPGPVDPGFGIPLPPVTVWPSPPVVGGGPVIPPTYPVDPGFGQPRPPTDPGYVGGVPVPPHGPGGGGEHPGGGPVYPPTDPGWGRPPPVPPHVSNELPRPPVHVWPPLQPVYPDLPIYLPPEYATGQPLPPGSETDPGYGIEAPPGSVWPPLPGIEGKVLALVWLVGYGYRWTVIDPSLKPPVGGKPPNGGGNGGGPAPAPS